MHQAQIFGLGRPTVRPVTDGVQELPGRAREHSESLRGTSRTGSKSLFLSRAGSEWPQSHLWPETSPEI